MRHVGAYDFKTGEEIWKLSGGGDIPVPTPVVSDGLVYITNFHGLMAPVYAIKDTASGDVSLKDGADKNAAVAWSYPRGGGYMSTPLVYRGVLYVITYNGVLTGYDAEDRREVLHPAAGRRQQRVHRFPGRRRREGLFRQRGRPRVRAEGRPDLRARRHQRDGRKHVGHAGVVGRNDVLADAGSDNCHRDVGAYPYVPGTLVITNSSTAPLRAA